MTCHGLFFQQGSWQIGDTWQPLPVRKKLGQFYSIAKRFIQEKHTQTKMLSIGAEAVIVGDLRDGISPSYADNIAPCQKHLKISRQPSCPLRGIPLSRMAISATFTSTYFSINGRDLYVQVVQSDVKVRKTLLRER